MNCFSLWLNTKTIKESGTKKVLLDYTYEEQKWLQQCRQLLKWVSITNIFSLPRILSKVVLWTHPHFLKKTSSNSWHLTKQYWVLHIYLPFSSTLFEICRIFCIYIFLFFKLKHLKSFCILLGHCNCQSNVCVTLQPVTNFFIFCFHLLPVFIAEETLKQCLLSSTGEPLDSQTAPGPHAKICGSCLWHFKNCGGEQKKERKVTR